MVARFETASVGPTSAVANGYRVDTLISQCADVELTDLPRTLADRPKVRSVRLRGHSFDYVHEKLDQWTAQRRCQTKFSGCAGCGHVRLNSITRFDSSVARGSLLFLLINRVRRNRDGRRKWPILICSDNASSRQCGGSP